MGQTKGGSAVKRARNIWVLGGDPRQEALARLLAEDGHGVHTFALGPVEGTEEERELDGLHLADCVILPLPAAEEDGTLRTPGRSVRVPMERITEAMERGQLLCAGMARPALTRLAEERGIVLRDYFAREELAIANAVLTAEGAVQLALEELPITLHCARVLVVGYGRLGRVTAQRMAALGARVTVAARSYEQLAWAEVWGYETEQVGRLCPWLCSYDLAVNTVPAPVLGERELAALRKGTPVMDLASRPGGVDREAARRLGVKVIWALSLPGRTAPQSAGSCVKTTIYHIVEELEA